jgi:hypothetical protein
MHKSAGLTSLNQCLQNTSAVQRGTLPFTAFRVAGADEGVRPYINLRADYAGY